MADDAAAQAAARASQQQEHHRMSGRWMTAGDRFAGYRSDVPGAQGDGLSANLPTRAVLRELCRVAHDAGVAQIGIPRLMRVGISEPAVKRALARLQRDELIVRAVRGTGNRHGSQPRESIWVVHQLLDVKGVPWPDGDWLQAAWQAYLLTPRYLNLDPINRKAVENAWAGGSTTDQNGLYYRSPLTPQYTSSSPEKRAHPRSAARRRAQLRVVKDETA